jgi:hypothetical protein
MFCVEYTPLINAYTNHIVMACSRIECVQQNIWGPYVEDISMVPVPVHSIYSEYCNTVKLFVQKIWGYHAAVAGVSDLLRCDMALGE